MKYINPLYKEIEQMILKYRYHYYIKNNPLISDYLYDMFESFAKSIMPKDSVVHKVGSDLEEDYKDLI